MFFTDTEKPKVTYCPEHIYKIIVGSTAVVTWTEATFSDNVKVTKIDSTFKSGDTFHQGTTNVYYTADDAAGNRNDECYFTVQLRRKFLVIFNFVNRLVNSHPASRTCFCLFLY